MANNDDFRVVVYQHGPYAKWALPSVDPYCVTIQAFLKFCGIPFSVNNCNNPSMSTTGALPVVAFTPSTTVSDPQKIIQKCVEMGYDLDRHLDETQHGELRAFRSLLEESLHNVQLYNMWLEPQNYESATSSIYGRRYPFPLSLILPRRERATVLSRLTSYKMTDRDSVYDEAKALYKALASKLGANEYFFGDRPTTLDAYAYGFLLTQLVPDVPSRQLHFLISTHDNLVGFLNRITQNFFGAQPLYINPEPARRYFKEREEKSKAKEETNDDAVFKRNSAYTIALGALSMAVFLMAYNKPVSSFVSKRFGSESYSPSELNIDDDDDMSTVDVNDLDEADLDEFDDDDE